mmetsp:Transcript_4262/g.16667  ORF Transcript_4262/g.16667 Transcript_4262/m.16667 type:complete len:255 (-) Transcript_4262:823-1587(-)
MHGRVKDDALLKRPRDQARPSEGGFHPRHLCVGQREAGHRQDNPDDHPKLHPAGIHRYEGGDVHKILRARHLMPRKDEPLVAQVHCDHGQQAAEEALRHVGHRRERHRKDDQLYASDDVARDTGLHPDSKVEYRLTEDVAARVPAGQAGKEVADANRHELAIVVEGLAELHLDGRNIQRAAERHHQEHRDPMGNDLRHRLQADVLKLEIVPRVSRIRSARVPGDPAHLSCIFKVVARVVQNEVEAGNDHNHASR